MSSDMPADVPLGPTVGREPAPLARGRTREVIYRHTLVVRISHWVNALAIFLLIGTGLNIFNAHAQLYWGQKGSELDTAILSIHAEPAAHGAMHGVLQIGALKIPTTGVLGWSGGGERAWPAWLTVPSFTDLADARHWHFMLAWILAINGLAYLVWSLARRHIQRDLWPTVKDLRSLPQDVLNHLKNKHPTGEAAKNYNILQKLAYLGVIVLVTGMVMTGLTMSPGIDAAAPWLLELFGGRQSARTIHFFCASLIVLFILVHLSQVVLAGPVNEMRSIITGKFAVPQEHD